MGGALANRDDPGVVRALHEEYLMSGADVITTNNFVVTEHTLGKVFGEHEGAAMLSELTRVRFPLRGQKSLLAFHLNCLSVAVSGLFFGGLGCGYGN